MKSDIDTQIGADGQENQEQTALAGYDNFETDEAGPGEGDLRPFVTMLTETQHVLGLAGLSANVANAIVDPTAAMPNPDLLVEYAPRPTPELLAIKASMNTLPKGRALSTAYQKFLNRLRATDSSTTGSVNFSRNSYGVPTRSLANLTSALHAACRTGLDVMAEIEPMSGCFNFDISTMKEWSDVRRMLRDGNDGGHSLVRTDGTVDLPEWLVHRAKERRIVRRLKLRAQVTLWHNAGKQSVTLRDITRLGLAIEGVYGVAPGDEVMLRLPTGEEAMGTIRWFKGGRAGIQLAAELVEQLRA